MPNLYIVYLLLLLYQYRGIGISARRYVDGYNRNRVRRVVYSCIETTFASVKSALCRMHFSKSSISRYYYNLYNTYKL